MPRRAATLAAVIEVLEEAPRRENGVHLNSFYYLPATFTTLFVLAASLLLGLI